MKTFIVLGMHRSATSLMAKGLAAANVNMGPVLLGPSRSNVHGHYEDVDFMHLNDRILNAAGGTWDNPPDHGAVLAVKHLFADEISSLVDCRNKNNQNQLWGWKEPRTVLTIWLYVEYLINPHFIFCFRDVEDVAASLLVRDDMPIEKGRELAREYNKRLMYFILHWNDKNNRSIDAEIDIDNHSYH